MKCVTVSYGKVTGKAKNYPYFQPALYKTAKLKNGKFVWKYCGHLGTARRSVNKATNDAKEYAKDKLIAYIDGVRNNNLVEKF